MSLTCQVCISSCSQAVRSPGQSVIAMADAHADIPSWPHPALDLKSARELGAKALRAVAEGRDPAHDKIQARLAKIDTIYGAVAQFIERHCKQSNRPRTIETTERLLRLHVRLMLARTRRQ